MLLSTIAVQTERDITEQTRLDKFGATIVSRAVRTLCLGIGQSIDRPFSAKVSSLNKFCKKEQKPALPTKAWSLETSNP